MLQSTALLQTNHNARWNSRSQSRCTVAHRAGLSEFRRGSQVAVVHGYFIEVVYRQQKKARLIEDGVRRLDHRVDYRFMWINRW